MNNNHIKMEEECVVLEDVLTQNGMIDDLFYYNDVKDRKFFFNEMINDDSVFNIVRHIIDINKQDKGKPIEERKPIMIYLNTVGGDVESGFSMVDTIMNSKTPVHIINIGDGYSMGFLICLAGHKRYAFKNSRFLLHDGCEYIYDSASKADDLKKFTKAINNRIRDYVLDRTNISSQKYGRNRRKEWYMFADEAKDLGVIDYIIGDDVDLDEVL